MGKGSLGQPHHKQHQEKGKNIIIDQEGFQQVRSGKNTRQNIFGSDQDMGQDKVWKGTTNNHTHANEATATAAAHDNARKGQQLSEVAYTIPTNNTLERTVGTGDGAGVFSGTKDGASTEQQED